MKTILTNWIMGILFTFGILIAGSDGAWFPWVNFAGIGLLGLMLGFEKIFIESRPPPRR